MTTIAEYTLIATKATLLLAAAQALEVRIRVDRGSTVWYDANGLFNKANEEVKKVEELEAAEAAARARNAASKT